MGKEKRREAVGDRDKAKDNQAAVMLMKDSHFKYVLTYSDYSFSHPHSYRLSYILSLQQHRTVLLTTFACIIDFGKWEEEILAGLSSSQSNGYGAVAVGDLRPDPLGVFEAKSRESVGDPPSMHA